MLSAIGHNQPPSAVDLAKPIAEETNHFLSDHPTLMNEEEARAAKLQLDRITAALDSIEIERKAKVDPLNTKVKAINAEYHAYHNADPKRPTTWDKLREAVKSRLTVYARRLEAERQEAARIAREAVLEAERKAREAEQREREAAEEARMGVCGGDLQAASQEANDSFREFLRSGREAQRADRNTKVRIGGGFGKVSTLRTKEILSVTDWKAAIEAIGLTERIAAAIVTDARSYREHMGELPPGIERDTERTL